MKPPKFLFPTIHHLSFDQVTHIFWTARPAVTPWVMVETYLNEFPAFKQLKALWKVTDQSEFYHCNFTEIANIKIIN